MASLQCLTRDEKVSETWDIWSVRSAQNFLRTSKKCAEKHTLALIIIIPPSKVWSWNIGRRRRRCVRNPVPLHYPKIHLNKPIRLHSLPITTIGSHALSFGTLEGCTYFSVGGFWSCRCCWYEVVNVVGGGGDDNEVCHHRMMEKTMMMTFFIYSLLVGDGVGNGIGDGDANNWC